VIDVGSLSDKAKLSGMFSKFDRPIEQRDPVKLTIQFNTQKSDEEIMSGKRGPSRLITIVSESK